MIGPFAGAGVRPHECLGEWISEYVDGSLPASEQLCADRHLVACQGCRAEVDLERRLRTTLRSERAVPDQLVGMLMSLSQEIPVGTRERGTTAPPPVSLAPRTAQVWAVAGQEVRVLNPDAPPQHRSALRAAALAGAAAGVSMVAVWAFSTAPAATIRPAPAAVLPTPRATGDLPALGGQGVGPMVVRARAQSSTPEAQSTP